MPLKEILARNLKSIRISQQLTLTTFAQKLDIGRSTLCSLESGRLNTTLDMVEQIAEALQVTPLQLLSDPSADNDLHATGVIVLGRDELESMPPEKRQRVLLQMQAVMRELAPYAEKEP